MDELGLSSEYFDRSALGAVGGARPVIEPGAVGVIGEGLSDTEPEAVAMTVDVIGVGLLMAGPCIGTDGA